MESKQFGRLYVRLLFCQLLMDVGSGPTYGNTVEKMKRSSLVSWHSDTWQEFKDSLTDAKKACLRRDSGVKVLSAAVKESSEIDPDKAEKPCFMKGYEYPFKACQLNQILSPLRFKLEKQLMESKTGAPKVNASKVEELLYVNFRTGGIHVVALDPTTLVRACLNLFFSTIRSLTPQQESE